MPTAVHQRACCGNLIPGAELKAHSLGRALRFPFHLRPAGTETCSAMQDHCPQLMTQSQTIAAADEWAAIRLLQDQHPGRLHGVQRNWTAGRARNVQRGSSDVRIRLPSDTLRNRGARPDC